ncbi:porin family protein [Terriglobus roseus]|nr:porin family protein [Terriglobus roseus]
MLASAVFPGHVSGQASSTTASRSADLQIGGSYTGASAGYDSSFFYGPERLYGYGGYASLDFKYHYGVEVNIRQLNSSASDHVYERTYEFGGRYVRHYGRFAPYARVSYGRGVFNFRNDAANLAYNLYAFAGGVDVNVVPSINVRGDFDYQKWMGFPAGLSPKVVSVGVAYHFH